MSKTGMSKTGMNKMGMSGSSPLVIVPVLSTPGVADRLLHPLAGRSSLARTLDAATGELPSARIVVTTDDPRIADAARAAAPSVDVHDRRQHDYVPALIEVLEATGDDHDIVVILEPTHPFRPAGLVARTAENLATRDELDSVVCVRLFRANLWADEGDGQIVAIGPGGADSASSYYQELVGLGLATRPGLLRMGRRLGDAVGFEVVDQIWSLVDVRDGSGLTVAEAVAPRLAELA